MKKDKIKTAAAMGMAQLYTVGTHRAYIKQNDYWIRAQDRTEAQRIWDEYQERLFQDPSTPLPEGIAYRHRAYRDEDYGYDYDNSLTTVEEVKFSQENPTHHSVLDELYPDQ